LTQVVRASFRIGDQIKFTAGALIDRQGVVAARVNGAKYRVDVGPLSVIASADQIILASEAA
jgi:hypothetical protein